MAMTNKRMNCDSNWFGFSFCGGTCNLLCTRKASIFLFVTWVDEALMTEPHPTIILFAAVNCTILFVTVDGSRKQQSHKDILFSMWCRKPCREMRKEKELRNVTWFMKSSWCINKSCICSMTCQTCIDVDEGEKSATQKKEISLKHDRNFSLLARLECCIDFSSPCCSSRASRFIFNRYQRHLLRLALGLHVIYKGAESSGNN